VLQALGEAIDSGSGTNSLPANFSMLLVNR
jgi:hypothetical protein